MTKEQIRTQKRIQLIFIPIFLFLLIYVTYLAANLYLGRQTKADIKTYFTSAISGISNAFVTRNIAFFRYVADDESTDYSKPVNYLIHQSFPVSDFVFMDENDAYFANIESENDTTINMSEQASDGEVFADTPTQDSLTNEPYYEDNDENDSSTTTLTQNTFTGTQKEVLAYNQTLISKLKSTLSRNFLIENFYHVNDKTGIDPSVFNVKQLLSKDVTITKDNSKPQILIYHTHANEWFKDSDKSNTDDLMLGVGKRLAQILTDEYGYNVIHHEGIYDTGVHKKAYMKALPKIEEILKKNPSIKVVFDLHRDGVNGDKHTVVNIGGKTMAKLMFFNGVSYNKSGPIKYLNNPNLQTNLAFSLQMKLYSMKKYPELTKKNFLKSYRYNMHLRGRYSLVEVGDQNNTVEEAKNAMIPLATIIDSVLSGKTNE